MTFWTLEYDGSEKSFAEWGITTSPRRRRVNRGEDMLTFTQVFQDANVAPQFPPFVKTGENYKTIKVRRDRVKDEDGSFSGGEGFFLGVPSKFTRSQSGSDENHTYEVSGPWFFLTRTVYRQPCLTRRYSTNCTDWKDFETCSLHVTDEITFYSPHIWLNTIANAQELYSAYVWANQQTLGYLSTGVQIAEALDYAINAVPDAPPPYLTPKGAGLGNVLQYDPTGFPMVNIRIDEARCIMVTEVIERMLRWSPDAVLWFDYTTEPPTLRCKRKANGINDTPTNNEKLNRVTVSPKELGGLAQEWELSPRYDIQVPCVDFFFSITNQIDNQPRIETFEDRYPPDKTGFEPFTLAAPIELDGATVVHEYATIQTKFIDTAGAFPPSPGDIYYWWKERVDWLRDGLRIGVGATTGYIRPIDNATGIISEAGTITDGGETNLNLQQELVSGNWSAWIPKDGGGVPSTSQKITVIAKAAYVIVRDPTIAPNPDGSTQPDNLVGTVRNKAISFKLLSTDAVSGTYSRLQSVDSGEPVPIGLAQAVYDSLSPLHQDGSIKLVEQEVSGSVNIGDVVCLLGSATEYETMDALVQVVDEDFESGTTTITVGPPGNLSADDLIELMRMVRFRRIWRAPQFKTDAASSNSVTHGEQVPRQDANQGDTPYEFFGVFNRAGETGGAVVIDAVGTIVTPFDESRPNALLSSADLTNTPSIGSPPIEIFKANATAARFREMKLCIDGDENWFIAILCSLPYRKP